MYKDITISLQLNLAHETPKLLGNEIPYSYIFKVFLSNLVDHSGISPFVNSGSFPPHTSNSILLGYDLGF